MAVYLVGVTNPMAVLDALEVARAWEQVVFYYFIVVVLGSMSNIICPLLYS